MIIGNLHSIFVPYIDDSIFDNCKDDEEYAELEDYLLEKYGTTDVLMPDAPPEAVKAWQEMSRMLLEARAQGICL